MKRFVVTIFLSITLVFFILPEAFAVSDNSEEYTITSYNIDLVVNENNTFDITENIESDFKIPKH
jgi:hypothetical protein